MDESTAVEVVRAAPMALPEPIRGVEFEETWRIAKALAMSGFFRDSRGAAQAFAKILFGRDLGLGPTQAMQAIHIIEGRPELSANLQAQRVKQYVGVGGERYDYRIKPPHTGERCEIAFYRRRPGEDWEHLGDSEFTLDDARRAGLVKDKSNWVKWPRNMVFARAVSNGVAWFCPEVMGGLRVYAEGEVMEQREVEFGSAGEEGEDLAYLARPQQSEPTVEGEAVEDDSLYDDAEMERARAVAELTRIDLEIVAAERDGDEDRLAELSAQRDAMTEGKA